MSEDLAEQHGPVEDALVNDDRNDRRAFSLPKKSTSAGDIERRIAEARGRIEARLSHKKVRDVRSPEQRGNSWLLASAREIFGDALTLVVLTGRRERTSSLDLDIALGALADRQNASSLRAAVDIANELLKVEAKSTVQAWFVGQNPMLDDLAPAVIVRTDPDAVWDAARHFVAYG